jgi:hypothetical protein
MSMDLFITNSLALDISILEEFVQGKKGLGCQITPEADCSWITLMTADGAFLAVSVWGPEEIEEEQLEELEEAVLKIVTAPKWSWQLSVSAGAPFEAVNVAKELSCFIAKKGKGASFDPQEEKILFPR